MKVKLVIDDLEFPVGYELLETIADRIGDYESLAELYQKLANSTNPAVRKAIAYYDKIPEDVVELLAKDNEPEVVERVLSNNIARVSEDTIRNIIENSPTTDILKAIVNRFDNLEVEEPNEILNLIIEKYGENLEVLGEIAESWEVPKFVLKKLAQHEDPDIVKKAKEALER
ncbi:hypothetical protein ThvES_00003540 [Thiovulum sp. ES]|nr:hypothetical protein ThvES_00003540 [Thiovulum sp. ES]